MTDEQRLEYQQRLVDPENLVYLTRALKHLPRGILRKTYLSCFAKRPVQGLRFAVQEKQPIVRLAGTRDEHVLEALSKLYAEQKLLNKYAQIWLDVWKTTIEMLKNSQTPDSNTPNEVLNVVYWLLKSNREDQVTEFTPDILKRLAAQEARMIELEALNNQNRTQTSRFERQLKEANTKLETQRLTDAQRFAKRVEDQRIKLEAQAQRQLESEKRELNLKLEKERRELLNQLKKSESENVFLTAQLDQVTDELEANTTAKQLQTELEQEKINRVDLNKRLLENEQELLEREDRLKKLRIRNLELETQTETIRREHQQLEKHVTQSHRTQSSPIPEQMLEQTLILEYQQFASNPIERFIALFSAYRALLKHDFAHETLVQHSNIAQFETKMNEPQSILVLGMERLLEDGANMALKPLLGLKILRQESVLQQLINKLESPRLQGRS